jgi:hypothetical protein
MRRCDLHHSADLTGYFATTVRGAVRRVLGDESLIRTPSSTRHRARVHGTAGRLYAFETASLDIVMHPFGDHKEREPLTSSPLPTGAAPARDPALRAQVEEWVALLSPRAQAVLRLRYGLSDENERTHSTVEIARLLGLPYQAVQQAERDALRQIRALVAGEAYVGGRVSQPRIRRKRQRTERATPARSRNTPVIVPVEQEARLMQTALHLQVHGIDVTLRRLASESGVPAYLVQAFLRTHRDEFPAVTAANKHRQALSQVAQVYAQLLARGEPVTSSKKLAKAAHVRIDTALEFLRAERSKQHAIA